MKEKDKLKKVVREEVKKIFENHVEAMTSNIEEVDEIQKKVNRLWSDVSDQAFEGYLKRGDVEKVQSKLDEVDEILSEIQGIFINERGKAKQK